MQNSTSEFVEANTFYEYISQYVLIASFEELFPLDWRQRRTSGRKSWSVHLFMVESPHLLVHIIILAPVMFRLNPEDKLLTVERRRSSVQ